MNAFFLLYAITMTVEFILTLVMAMFIFLIVTPPGRSLERHPDPPPARPLARSVPAALGDAFATISEGHNDLATITNARSLLVRYMHDHEEARRGTLPS